MEVSLIKSDKTPKDITNHPQRLLGPRRQWKIWQQNPNMSLTHLRQTRIKSTPPPPWHQWSLTNQPQTIENPYRICFFKKNKNIPPIWESANSGCVIQQGFPHSSNRDELALLFHEAMLRTPNQGPSVKRWDLFHQIVLINKKTLSSL